MILKRYQPTKRGHNNSQSNCFSWNSDHEMYVTRTYKNPIDHAIITGEDVFRFTSGEVIHIFPQYDCTKHILKRNLTDTDCAYNFTNDSIVSVTLYEIMKPETVGLPYGIFRCKSTYNSTGLCPMTFSSDDYLEIGQDFDICKDFMNFKNKIKLSGIRNKRAILLYGPPGNGKTASICKLAKIAETEKFRVFFLDSNFPINELKEYKQILNDETTVFVIEELTERLNNKVEEVLSFLDGQTSWDNSYIVATTNHPEELPLNIIDRPGRFKVIQEIKNPNAIQRANYFKAMNMPLEEIDAAVVVTEGLSFDYVKSALLDSQADGKSIENAVKEYTERKTLISKNFKQKLGI